MKGTKKSIVSARKTEKMFTIDKVPRTYCNGMIGTDKFVERNLKMKQDRYSSKNNMHVRKR